MSTELLGGVMIVLFFLAIWLTHFLAYNRGRLAGLHEAAQRDRHRRGFDYRQGQLDTLGRTLVFLRFRGARAEAEALPTVICRQEREETSNPEVASN